MEQNDQFFIVKIRTLEVPAYKKTVSKHKLEFHYLLVYHFLFVFEVMIKEEKKTICFKKPLLTV